MKSWSSFEMQAYFFVWLSLSILHTIAQSRSRYIATNISILTTTQSSIAADLDAFEQATWFTSSYLIAMSSLAPLMGRLSQIFSPRLCMFTSTVIICAGTIVTSTSNSFAMFMVGRALTGAGAAGVLIVAIIVVIQMTSPKRRGLFIGLANSGMTVGVSLGAVIAGALEPEIGWVSMLLPRCAGLLQLIHFTETPFWDPGTALCSCRIRATFWDSRQSCG